MVAKLQRNDQIPVIDFAPLVGENFTKEDLVKVGVEVYDAFRHVGFAYIKNHSVPQELVDEAFEWSSKFFALPQSEKDKVPHPPQGWFHRGYSGVGVEKVSQMVFDKDGLAQERKRPDVKESYELGYDHDTKNDHDRQLHNIWPAENVIPGFKDFYMKFFEVCYDMEIKLLRAIAEGMKLDEWFFVNYHKTRNNQIRLLHYPPVEEALLTTGKVSSIGAHTDYATLTMLFQDEVGGLEVEDIDVKGKFSPAPYIPGTMVVNIGDFLMRWSNDELKSTLHRVRAPTSSVPPEDGQPAMTTERYSIPYFVVADEKAVIDCVPGCSGEGRPKKYAPINARDYIDMRLNASYT